MTNRATPDTPGLIHIYTGDGKGKTTAAVGLAVRCAGSGRRVVFCQFMKNNRSAELNILRQLPKIQLVQAKQCFGFYKYLDDEQRAAAAQVCSQLLEQAIAAAQTADTRLLVLDEAISSYNHGLLPRQRLLDFLQHKPAGLEVALTGRDPAPELAELADYLSDIRKIKHPFDKGIAAREGIEK